MELRRATGSDVEAALEVWRAALARAGQRPPAARVARVAEKLAAPDALLVVAVDGEQVVGFALGEWGRAGDVRTSLIRTLCPPSPMRTRAMEDVA